MSYIHFKSAFGREFDKITFDGVSLSVGEIKKMIAEKCKLSKQLDFDLEITNAETSQGKKYRTQETPRINNYTPLSLFPFKGLFF